MMTDDMGNKVTPKLHIETVISVLELSVSLPMSGL